jgi:hypothetical protein
MTNLVTSAGIGRGIEQHVDLSRLDREQIPRWIDTLREAEANIRHLRGQLTAILQNSGRSCPVCDTAVTGPVDGTYRSATCRQRARRAGAHG